MSKNIKFMLKTASLFIVTILFLSSCNNKVKEKIGLVTPGPNEYQVQPGKSLEIPPHYYLPSPTSSTHNKVIEHIDGNVSNAEKALLDDLDKK